MTAPVIQATGRQRRDGRCPSGKSRNTKVIIGPMPAAHPQPPTHASHLAPGMAPGFLSNE